MQGISICSSSRSRLFLSLFYIISTFIISTPSRLHSYTTPIQAYLHPVLSFLSHLLYFHRPSLDQSRVGSAPLSFPTFTCESSHNLSDVSVWYLVLLLLVKMSSKRRIWCLTCICWRVLRSHADSTREAAMCLARQ